ncbi:hypothetical protein B0F90DRAFT_204909 [Multifurca ochricompacta]|uniref:Uncharacterized protein n=1 Tax=Multifurca ochricompacta TaxID=376703 RepID=A0AAD4M7C4_9AGAM|nr:hypothetical protein B0F90DRAFT_204909 [Multifurca ochricompacta]
MSDTSGSSDSHVRLILNIWFTFQIIGGHFLTPLLLITFLFSKAKRDATLFSLGVTLVLSSICNCLLLYTNQYLGPEPNKVLCIFQAACFGASAPMLSVATMALVWQIRSRVKMKAVEWLSLIIVAPYITFVAFLIVITVLGSRRPDTVTRARRKFYCSIESRVISLISIAFTSTAALLATGFTVTLCFQICRFLRIVHQTRRGQIPILPLATRFIIFMMYLFFAFGSSLWSIRDRQTFIRDIYASTFGIAYFIVFGTQRDVLQAWHLCRKDTSRTKFSTDTGAQTIDGSRVLQLDISLDHADPVSGVGTPHAPFLPTYSAYTPTH